MFDTSYPLKDNEGITLNLLVNLINMLEIDMPTPSDDETTTDSSNDETATDTSDVDDDEEETRISRLADGTITLLQLTAQGDQALEVGEQLFSLIRDVASLLATEGHNIIHLSAILTKRASILFPLINKNTAEGMIASKLKAAQSAITKAMCFGINPAATSFVASKVLGKCVPKIDPGKDVLKSAIHSADGPASHALDLYEACSGVYHLYNSYTELTRLYASILFCFERLDTIRTEILALARLETKWKTVSRKIAAYWNQPGFDLNAFLDKGKRQFQVILAPLQPLVDLYESLEPLRISTYFAISMRAEPNAESQLDQITHLLTNACYNTALDNLDIASKSAGYALGKALPTMGIGIGLNAGVTAALTTCATTVTGMSFPITIAILATCITDASKRTALIAYAKNRFGIHNVGEQKSDDDVQAVVYKQLEALKDSSSSFLDPLTAPLLPIKKQLSEKIQQAMEMCCDASGAVVGNIVEKTIRGLICDSEVAILLQEKLDSVIYQILDEILIQILQIPEKDAILKTISEMSGNKAVVYQVCGILIPNMMHYLALPDFLEKELVLISGNPKICKPTALSFTEKALGAIPRAVYSGVIIPNITATHTIIRSMTEASLQLKKVIQKTEAPSLTPVASENFLPYIVRTTYGKIIDNALALPLDALGSVETCELRTGLRVYFLEKGTPLESIPTPLAIVYSRTQGFFSRSITIESFRTLKAGKIVSSLRTRTQTHSVAQAQAKYAQFIAKQQQESKSDNIEYKDFSKLIAEWQQIIQVSTNNMSGATESPPSILVPWQTSNNPSLANFLDEVLDHYTSDFNYVLQLKYQKQTLMEQNFRQREAEEAAELKRLETLAEQYGYGKAFFQRFESIPDVQERDAALRHSIDNVNIPIIEGELTADDSRKTKQWITTHLRRQSNKLHISMEQATIRFKSLRLNTLQIQERFDTVSRAIDKVKIEESRCFPSGAKENIDKHYLALLKMKKVSLAKDTAELAQPLEDFKNRRYNNILTHIPQYPESALHILIEVEIFKKSFWFLQHWPADLIAFEASLFQTEAVLAITQPLEAFKKGRYNEVADYITQRPECASFFLTKIALLKNTYWIFSYPATLLKLEQSIETVIDNKLNEAIPKVLIHLPQVQEPAVSVASPKPPVIFVGTSGHVSPPNTPQNTPKQSTAEKEFPVTRQPTANFGH